MVVFHYKISSPTAIWCAMPNTKKVSEFTGTLVFVWDEVKGAHLWLHGTMKHHTQDSKSQHLRGW